MSPLVVGYGAKPRFAAILEVTERLFSFAGIDSTLSQLREIDGIGDARLERYGDDILKVLRPEVRIFASPKSPTFTTTDPRRAP